MNFLRIISAVFFFLATLELSAIDIEDKINERWRWVSFTPEKYLNSGIIQYLIEASDGTIWTVTNNSFFWYDGFLWNKVDGRNFPEHRTSARKLKRDSGSGLLFCENGRMFRVKKNGIIKLDIMLDDKPAYILNAVLFEGKKYLLQIKIGKNGHSALYIFDNENLEIMDFPGELLNYDFYGNREVLYRTRSGDIFCNNSNSIFQFSDGKWVRLFTPKDSSHLDIPIIETNESGNGFFFVAFPKNDRGLYKYFNGRVEKIRDTEEYILLNLDYNDKGDFICAFHGGMILYYSNNKWHYLENVPENMTIYDKLLMTESGDIWYMNPYELYLVKISSERWTYWNYGKSDPRNFVNGIIKREDGTIWIASGKGIEIRKPGTEIKFIESIDGKLIHGINSMIEDKDRNIWISSGGTFTGTYRWDGEDWEHFEIARDSVYVHRISTGLDNKVWFLTLSGEYLNKGFGAFYYENGSFHHFKEIPALNDARVYGFINDAEDSYWFGTTKGIFRWENGVSTEWNKEKYDISGSVYCLGLDTLQRRVWFSDLENGIGFFSNDSIIYPEIMERVSYGGVVKIEFDANGDMWVATTTGMFYVKDGKIFNINYLTGIQWFAVATFMISRDKIYIGTNGKGINILSTKEKDDPLPKVKIDEPKIKKGAVYISWSKYSYYGQLRPESIEIQYKIDGGTWSDWTLAQELTLFDMEPGKHSIEIRPKGIFGRVPARGSFMEFQVPAPLYMQAGFVIPVSLLIIVLLGILFKYYYNRRKYVTNLQNAFSTLEEQEKTLSAILSASPVGIFYEVDNNIQWANSSFYKITGYREDRIVGMNKEMLEAEEKKKMPSKAGLFFPDDKLGETRWKNSRGEIIDILIFRNPVDKNDNSKGYIYVVTDISERKDFERQQKIMMQAVLDAEKKKNEASKLIENSLRIGSIGVIAGGITHEINQPLNVIRVGSEGLLLMNKQGLLNIPEQFQNIITGIAGATKKIDEIVKHMRTFWIDSGEKEYINISVSSFLSEISEVINLRAAANGIRLIIDDDRKEKIIRAHPVQLELVINNLVNNAINSHETSRPHDKWIHIISLLHDDKVIIEVHDNGGGLPEVDPDKLFDPFFSTSIDEGGTGLGLAIVKMFLDSFEAGIKPYNNENGGASFVLEFNSMGVQNE